MSSSQTAPIVKPNSGPALFHLLMRVRACWIPFVA